MWPVFWVFLVVTATAVQTYDKRIFDLSSLPVQIVIIKAGENKSITCPGVSEHSLVLQLEWLTLTSHLKLVEFMSDTTTVWANQHRISLMSDTFGLSFHPAMAEDSADYICLVNSRPKPDAVVRLIVQDVPEPPGRPLIMSFTSRSVNLSWAPSQDTHHSPVTHYIIHTRELSGRAKERDNIVPENDREFRVVSVTLEFSKPLPSGTGGRGVHEIKVRLYDSTNGYTVQIKYLAFDGKFKMKHVSELMLLIRRA